MAKSSKPSAKSAPMKSGGKTSSKMVGYGSGKGGSSKGKC